MRVGSGGRQRGRSIGAPALDALRDPHLTDGSRADFLQPTPPRGPAPTHVCFARAVCMRVRCMLRESAVSLPPPAQCSARCWCALCSLCPIGSSAEQLVGARTCRCGRTHAQTPEVRRQGGAPVLQLIVAESPPVRASDRGWLAREGSRKRSRRGVALDRLPC